MTLSLIAFIASGVGLLIIIGIKMLQERSGMLLFWPDSREKVEIVLQRYAVSVRYFFQQFSKRNFYIVLHFLLSKIRTFAIFLQRKTDKQLVHLVNLIKGRQKLDMNRAKASHFLHDVTRFKDKFRRQ